ncbi:MAG: class I SAM-dependent methyltransferase [Pseudomonadota bacterium]
MPEPSRNALAAPAADPIGSSLALFICPSCRKELKALATSGDVLDCLHCGTSFPLLEVDGVTVPWLMPDPESARYEWKARLNGFLERNHAEQTQLLGALRKVARGSLAEKRLARLADALAAQRTAVVERLAPLGFDDVEFNDETDPGRRLANKLPANQGLSSYYDNLFRDWAWDNGENETLAGIVRDLLRTAGCKRPGRMATLGAGACRLPYDLHRAMHPAQSIVVDFNPLLLLTAVAVMAGRETYLHEIPVAPRGIDEVAHEQLLRAPAPLPLADDDSFLAVLGDVTNLPFADATIDVVVTPWLIDIISEEFSSFARRINAHLAPDGLWVNTGSLAFFGADPLHTYSAEEVLDIVESNGFEIVSARRDTVPYLCSPLSAHGRQEELFSFVARKCRDAAPADRHRVLPDWLIDLSQPIPTDAARAIESSRHLLLAQVLGATDGKRSVEALGTLLAEHHGLAPAEAIHAVRRIFVEQLELRAPARSGAAP